MLDKRGALQNLLPIKSFKSIEFFSEFRQHFDFEVPFAGPRIMDTVIDKGFSMKSGGHLSVYDRAEPSKETIAFIRNSGDSMFVGVGDTVHWQLANQVILPMDNTNLGLRPVSKEEHAMIENTWCES